MARRGEDFIRAVVPVNRRSLGDIRSSLNLRCKRSFIVGEIGGKIACRDLLEQLSGLLEESRVILEELGWILEVP